MPLHLISVAVWSLVIVSRERVMYVDLGGAQYKVKGTQKLNPHRSTADL